NPDRTERFTLPPFGPTYAGGVRVAAADFNGDGIADLVTGSGPGGPSHVRVFDGANQQELFSIDPFEAGFTGGVYVAAGDLNGDGKADLVAGGGPGGGPRVSVFDGAALLTNHQVRTTDFFADDTANRGGIRVAVKDLDGDGKADLVTGAGTGAGSRVNGFT